MKFKPQPSTRTIIIIIIILSITIKDYHNSVNTRKHQERLIKKKKEQQQKTKAIKKINERQHLICRGKKGKGSVSPRN